jgi:hypothetical protein
MKGTRSRPADTPDARIALIRSGASRKRMAIKIEKVPNPTSKIPPIELLIRSSWKVFFDSLVLSGGIGTDLNEKPVNMVEKESEIE